MGKTTKDQANDIRGSTEAIASMVLGIQYHFVNLRYKNESQVSNLELKDECPVSLEEIRRYFVKIIMMTFFSLSLFLIF